MTCGDAHSEHYSGEGRRRTRESPHIMGTTVVQLHEQPRVSGNTVPCESKSGAMKAQVLESMPGRHSRPYYILKGLRRN